MSDQFLQSQPVKGIMDITYTMWNKGWDESNGGNVSYILDEKEYALIDQPTEVFYELINIPKGMIGKKILITATFSHFRTLKDNPLENLGVIEITEKGYIVRWGYVTGKKPTSEVYMHLLSHNARLAIDSNHRVVVHNHATNAVAYSMMVEPNDADYTFPLWQVLTESVVVFPDGIGVLPWELPGTESIGLHTAEKLAQSRIVVWTFHGILATGSSYQDCFGLIETVDKAAKIYIDTRANKIYDGLNKDQILQVCKAMKVSPRYDILELK